MEATVGFRARGITKNMDSTVGFMVEIKKKTSQSPFQGRL